MTSSKKRPFKPGHHYSNSELRRIRRNASAIASQKPYNPFLPKQSNYHSAITSATRSQGASYMQPETHKVEIYSPTETIKHTPAATVAHPDSPHLHPTTYLSSPSSTISTPNKLQRPRRNSSGIGRMGSKRALLRGSSEVEREKEFGDLGTALPQTTMAPWHGGVMVTTEYEVESYRHSLGSTIR